MSGHPSLTDEQKKFILENYKSMSAKHIAKKLHVPRHVVEKYCAELLSGKVEGGEAVKNNRLDRFLAEKNVKIISHILFIAILLLAFNLRKHTFDLPHYRGDQHHYIGLAFKLDTQGISGYNLRGIDMYTSRQYPYLIQIAPAQDEGHVLKSLAQANITYYDEPLHHVPFGFPLAIMMSHKIFAPGQPYYALAIPDTKIIREAGPGAGLRNFRFDPAIKYKQFYAVIVPLAFSLLLIAATYFLAKTLFDDECVALVSMFLMCICPIDILTSQKVWADDMTAATTALAALFYMMAIRKKLPVLALIAGLSCGLSAITKPNGAIVAFAIVLWHFITNMDRLLSRDPLKVIFDKYLWTFGLGGFISAGYWYIKLMATYGSPVYKPKQAGLLEADASGWFRLLKSRPRHLYFFGIPYQNPLFGLAYFSPVMIWLRKKEAKALLFPIIWLAVTFFLSYRFFGKEHRYMLPSYPAYAILGAYVANRLRIFIDKIMGLQAGTVLLVIVLIVSAIWSIPMAMDVVFTNGALIMRPF